MNNILAEHLDLQDAKIRFEVTLNTLIDLIDYYTETKSKPQTKSIEPLLTQEEVINILKVDSSTLWRWRQIDYLKSIKIGGKLRYRQDDIIALVNEEGGDDL